MRQSLLLLTNSSNDALEEDRFLAEKMGEKFDVTVCHPLECENHEDAFDGILMRNIWPTHEHSEEFEEMKQRFKRKNLRTYNHLSGGGDMQQKGYLLELFKEGYPVIPSISTVKDLPNLHELNDFFVKPVDSCDGIGSRRLSREELLHASLSNVIIQPFMEFTEEIMFYFIDGTFHHALHTKKKLENFPVEHYTPTDTDLLFAQKFIEWNALPYGIQRIDAIRVHNGDLLLTEIEDWCPYLYLLELDADTRVNFLKHIHISLMKNIFSTRTQHK